MTNGEQLAAVLDSCAHAIQAFAQTLRAELPASAPCEPAATDGVGIPTSGGAALPLLKSEASPHALEPRQGQPMWVG